MWTLDNIAADMLAMVSGSDPEATVWVVDAPRASRLLDQRCYRHLDIYHGPDKTTIDIGHKRCKPPSA